MNLEKASVLLEKINSLHKAMQADGVISDIEKDLMKSYVRELYEIYLNASNAPSPVKIKKPNSFDTEVIRKKTSTKPKEAYKPPRIIEVPKKIEETPKAPPPIPVDIPAPRPIPKIQKKETPTPPIVTSSSNISKEVKALFKEKKAKELSEKLSASPIRDLTKAIALNDKLLFSNELFGGALVTFNEVVRTLNDLPTKVDAENYLMELAKQHDWAGDDRKDTAIEFIKLVRRRFS